MEREGRGSPYATGFRSEKIRRILNVFELGPVLALNTVTTGIQYRLSKRPDGVAQKTVVTAVHATYARQGMECSAYCLHRRFCEEYSPNGGALVQRYGVKRTTYCHDHHYPAIPTINSVPKQQRNGLVKIANTTYCHIDNSIGRDISMITACFCFSGLG